MQPLSTAERVLGLVGERLAFIKPDDRHDILDKNVASKLRGLPAQQRIHAENLINDILFTNQNLII